MEARKRYLGRFESIYLRNQLIRFKGNVSQAAEAADVDRKTFYRLLRKHNLQRSFLRKEPEFLERVGRVA